MWVWLLLNISNIRNKPKNVARFYNFNKFRSILTINIYTLFPDIYIFCISIGTCKYYMVHLLHANICIVMVNWKFWLNHLSYMKWKTFWVECVLSIKNMNWAIRHWVITIVCIFVFGLVWYGGTYIIEVCIWIGLLLHFDTFGSISVSSNCGLFVL